MPSARRPGGRSGGIQGLDAGLQGPDLRLALGLPACLLRLEVLAQIDNAGLVKTGVFAGLGAGLFKGQAVYVLGVVGPERRPAESV